MLRQSLPLILLLAASTATAEPGVIFINDALVQASGGYPFTIDSPGHYALAGPLSLPDANTSAIVITASGVTFDLRGFAISGPGGSGTAHGIDAAAGSDLTVRNGFVHDAPLDGVHAGPRALVEYVTSEDNGRYGIRTGDDSTVRFSRAEGNGGDGILVAGAGTVSANRVGSNGDDGIQVNGEGYVIERNVTRNQANLANTGFGIHVAFPGVVRENVSIYNDYGLIADHGVTVERNVFRSNEQFGAFLDDGNTIAHNVFFQTGISNSSARSLRVANFNTIVGNVFEDTAASTHLSLGSGNSAGLNGFVLPGQCMNDLVQTSANYCRTQFMSGQLCTSCAQ